MIREERERQIGKTGHVEGKRIGRRRGGGEGKRKENRR